jgi:hypothetical protein
MITGKFAYTGEPCVARLPRLQPEPVSCKLACWPSSNADLHLRTPLSLEEAASPDH